jgi:Holliday junction DNA helicase RuvB
MKPDDIELLRQIAEFEDSNEVPSYGWEWIDVRISPATLNRLYLDGLVDIVYKSNSRTGYKFTPKAKEILSIEKDSEEVIQTQDIVSLPDDLFDVIEGYSDIKPLIRQVLYSEKAVHVLFTGVPSSAKTMFLLELARSGAPYILGSQCTKAGIVDLLFETQPSILLIDEIDRIGTKDIAVLLSLTQTGIVSETKFGRHREIKLDTKVFAASNTMKMPPELLSRFMVLQFKPYSKADFLVVASNLLVKRENVGDGIANYIAEKVWASSQRFPDPRQAIRVARLAKTKDEVDKVLDIITRYSDIH